MTTQQLSRRAFSVRLAGLVPALAFVRPRLGALTQGDGISRTAEAIHQDVVFAASRERVDEALLDEKPFGKMTGQPTTIDRAPGGALSLFGARIKARNIELVPNQRIVQAWRSEGWDPGVDSLVRFELLAQGTGTKIAFDHTGFPVGQAEHLAAGWKTNYWDPMTKYLAG